MVMVMAGIGRSNLNTMQKKEGGLDIPDQANFSWCYYTST
jgi:hypothetical protein